MATGTLAPIAGSTTGGLSTIQDLYDLINGKTTSTSGGTTTTSGGTSTTTSSEGISQDSMNAMLQNALASTNGLAAISSGQRAAGGYGSSVNTMLTNDLLTRSAAQIAASNKNVTSTTTTPDKTVTTSPTTTQVGGATVSGVAKSAGFLAALQQLTSATESGKKLGGLLGIGSTAATPVSPLDPMTAANQAMSTPNQYATYGAGRTVAENSTATPAPTQAADTSSIDLTPLISPEPTPIPTVDAPVDSTPAPTLDTSVVDTGFANAGKAADDTSDSDFLTLADGGMVRAAGVGSKSNPARYADGGIVTKKSPNVLGTSQYNSVVDPREGLAGTLDVGANALNADGTPIGQTLTPGSNADSTPTSAPPTQSNSGGGGGGKGGGVVSTGGVDPTSATGPLADAIGGIISGDATSQDYGTLSNSIGLLGTLTGNKTLSNLGKVGEVASAGSWTQAGLDAANIASNGVVGQAFNISKTVMNPTLGNVTDTVASFNPYTALTNRVLGLVGLGSLGDIAGNIADRISPNNPMTAEQQDAKTTAAADNAKAIAAQDAKDAADAIAKSAVAVDGVPTPNSDIAAVPDATPTGVQDSVTPQPIDTGYNEYLSAAQNNELAAQQRTGSTGGLKGTDGATSLGAGGGGAGVNAGTSVNGSSINSISTPGAESTSTTTAADGGEISGPGTSVSDSIHAKLSDGEYVLSADTVKAIGIDKLDALQAKYHTPAATQRLLAYGKM